MNDARKILNLLGLCQRSKNLVSGEYQTEKAVKEGRAVLVIIAADASRNTKKKFHDMCKFYRVREIVLSDKEELGRKTGHSERSNLAITDDGFAKAILREYEAYNARR